MERCYQGGGFVPTVLERPCLLGRDVEEQVLGGSKDTRSADTSCEGKALDTATGCDDGPAECPTAVPLLHEVTGSSCQRDILQCDSYGGGLDHSGVQQTESVSELGNDGNEGQQAKLPDDQAALSFRTVVDFVAEQLAAARGGTWHSFDSLQDWLLLHGVACPNPKLVTEACMLAQELCLLKIEEDGVRVSVPAPWSWEDEDGETDQRFMQTVIKVVH